MCNLTTMIFEALIVDCNLRSGNLRFYILHNAVSWSN